MQEGLSRRLRTHRCNFHLLRVVLLQVNGPLPPLGREADAGRQVMCSGWKLFFITEGAEMSHVKEMQGRAAEA